MQKTTDEQVLEIERLIDAEPEAVFDAWVDPAILITWWGPEGVTTPQAALEVYEGGHWSTTMRTPGGDRVVSGVYRTIDRPRRLVFTWAWTQDDGSRGDETVVEVTFDPARRGTRMRLSQQRFETAENRDNHRLGWSSSFNDLEKLFA
ncbi:SRPBCC domain-containing protein [Nitratireductor sp. CAU 1489]|uniref:SRPBCC domain-containing protein n=1 Tax=Nitratireductor arenosus TaxID=2682096 RepID=A0A844QL03_9HYPH|nr:SRPBCC domain-containing protein [Nitratireductor arenosus]MVA98728.1 SRPBCC domain-containing protein [Nitratireductor arenosus]